MRRYQTMLLGAFLVCWASCGFADEGSTVGIVPQASLPTKVLGSIAAIGDSITQAFDAQYSDFKDCRFMDTPEYSFATNIITNTTISVAERAIAFKGSGVAIANFGSDGARMSSGDDQAREARTWLLTQATPPNLITVFLGHNDICSGKKDKFQGSCSSANRDPNNYCRTSTFAYEQEMRQMLDVLITIPESQIAIIHPIRVSQLCNFKDEKVTGSLVSCGDLWALPGHLSAIFEQDGVCPSLTSCSADRVADAYTTWVSYRDIGNKLVEEYNLYVAGDTIPFNPTFNTGGDLVVRATNVSLEKTDVVGNSKFKYRDASGNVQLSVCECYHPSKFGQNQLASSLWDGVTCSTRTPCCNDNVPGDIDYNKGLCNNYTTSGSLRGLWYVEGDKTLTVAKAGSGTGVVTSTPGVIDCGTNCTGTYSDSTLVTLTAIAAADSIFEGWSGGGCSGSGTCEVTMINDMTVTAAFMLTGSISDTSPAEGTIGTVLTINGSGFRTKKGKVLIGGMAAKIASWTDTTITAVIKKALPPGVYDLVLQPKEPKGAAPITLPDAFTIMAPDITSVVPNSGGEGVVISISGNYFGSKKGKVFVGDQKCKVTSWTMDPVTGESAISFVVHKKIGAATYLLEVENKVARSLSFGFTVK